MARGQLRYVHAWQDHLFVDDAEGAGGFGSQMKDVDGSGLAALAEECCCCGEGGQASEDIAGETEISSPATMTLPMTLVALHMVHRVAVAQFS